MKMKQTAMIVLLCLVLCLSLLPVAAFADQTVVIIGGSIAQDSATAGQGAATQNTTVISGGTGISMTIVADNPSNDKIVSSNTSASGSSVIVMPDGSVVSSKPAQSVQTVVTTTDPTDRLCRPEHASP